MSSRSSNLSSEQEVPLGSPNSPMQSRQSVRKRVTPGHRLLPRDNMNMLGNHPRPRINPNLISRDYDKTKGPVSCGMRLRSFLLTIFMVSFPMSIFLVPLWWNTPTYPRVVVAFTATSAERLDLLEPALTTLLDETMVPPISAVYVVVPHQYQDQLPAFLTELTTVTMAADEQNSEVSSTRKAGKVPTVQILSPQPDYAHSTVYATAIAALEAEQQLMEALEAAPKGEADVLITEHSILKETDVEGGDIRLLILDDHLALPKSSAIVSMVQASQAHPDSVVSTIGGNWKSKFRQVQRTQGKIGPDERLLDKAPNVWLHPASLRPEDVDISDTSAGVIFRVGRILPEVPALLARLDRLQAATSRKQEDVVWQPEAGDVIWNGLLDTHNITRTIVPVPLSIIRSENNSTSSTTDTLSRHHWMMASKQVQFHWKIWTDYYFWDWSELTQEQLQAMECEGKFAQDCSEPDRENLEPATMAPIRNACRPNGEHCGDYAAILAAMSPRT